MRSKPILIIVSSLWWVIFACSTIVMTFPVLIGFLFTYKAGFQMIRVWLHINLFTLNKLCGIDWDVTGLENINQEPRIIVSKHQSTWETLFLPLVIEQPVFVAKRELAFVPFFGWCLYKAESILIRRGTGRKAIKQIEEQAEKRFAEGRSIVIFPEGTRRAPGAEPRYKSGGAILSVSSGVSMIPVAHNAGEFWPRHSFIKWPGTISVIFGPEISPEGKTSDVLQRELVTWIEARQAEITVVDRFPY